MKLRRHASGNESDSEKDFPAEVRELVLDDQRSRSPICWNVFDD
jgi:hypothetical protein